MPGWVYWIIWGGLAVGGLATYAVILSSLATKGKRLSKRLEKIGTAAAKLEEAARLLDRSK